jgi:hypothetical protein
VDDRLKTISAELGRMSSTLAADWIMATFPVDGANFGDAISLIPRRSWKRSDQLRLARYYLRKIPFADSRPYEAFASFMAFDLFLKVIKEQMPSEKSDIDLLMYHLIPVMKRSARTESDRELARSFFAEAL